MVEPLIGLNTCVILSIIIIIIIGLSFFAISFKIGVRDGKNASKTYFSP